MSSGIESNSGAIKTGKRQRMKWHYVYDGNDRPTDIYEATAGASNGDPCMRTRYEYDGSSTRITNALETTSTWNSTWDIT